MEGDIVVKEVLPMKEYNCDVGGLYRGEKDHVDFRSIPCTYVCLTKSSQCGAIHALRNPPLHSP